MADAEASGFFDGRTVVLAEEKVDGANLGLSLTKGYEVRCQNRSHYVNPQSHAQFRSLQSWLDEHTGALCQLLAPEREVLFGEWLAVKHSVHYSRLPGLFLAFDIFDKRSGTFCSAAERDRRLRGSGIPVVRTMAKRAFGSKAELLTLLEQRSAYTDGFVEGAYLRIDAADGREADGGEADGRRVGTNVRRGKIVRADFVQGITEHWINAEIVKNVVRVDLWLEDETDAHDQADAAIVAEVA